MLTGLALAAPDGANAYLDPAALTEDDERALAAWLADPALPKALHDAKGPMHALAARGLELGGLTSDTALAAYLALPGQRSFDLADLAVRYVGRELTGGRRRGRAAHSGHGRRRRGRGGQRAGPAGPGHRRARRRPGRGPGAARRDAAARRRRAAAGQRAGRDGAGRDRRRRRPPGGHVGHLGGEVKAAEQAAYAVVGHEFNLGSPKQLQEVLFTELGLPKTKRIKTGYTTDSEALTSLLAQTEHPVLAHLLRHRDVARLKSIVDSLIPMAGVDGRIHTTYNQMIAATGRLSSTDPNLQNIPIRTEEGRRTRQAFIVGAGYETLLTADYSQIELRIMAHLSGDQALADAFTSGHDFHAETASRVFGVPPEEVTVELRSKIKAMNYGLAYGLSSYGLSQQLRVSPGRGQRVHGRLFRAVRRHQGLPGGDRRAGPHGRLHPDHPRPPPLPARPGVRQPAAPGDGGTDGAQRADPGLGRRHHQGGHAPVHDRIREQGLRSRMLLQVHDELLFEVAPGELDQLKELVHAEMCGASELTVPLEVSMGTGRSWAEAAH